MTAPALGPAVAPGPVKLPRGDAKLWATPLDVAELARHVAHCQSPAPSTTEHGARLERLAAWLFPHLPGLEVHDTNVFSADRAHEVDVPMFNDVSVPGALAALDSPVFVECKNYEHPVGGQEVAWFHHKLVQGGSTAGVLLTVHGVSGELRDRRFAQGVIAEALRGDRPRRILVVTLAEVAALTSTADLRALLVRRMLEVSSGKPF